MGEALDKVLLHAATNDALGLTKPYNRVEHGKLEHVGGYFARHKAARAAKRAEMTRRYGHPLPPAPPQGKKPFFGLEWGDPAAKGLTTNPLAAVARAGLDAGEKSAEPPQPQSYKPVEQLQILASLHKQGLLTDAEFEAKRRALVDKL